MITIFELADNYLMIGIEGEPHYFLPDDSMLVSLLQHLKQLDKDKTLKYYDTFRHLTLHQYYRGFNDDRISDC